jgi:RNA polymerase sigma-70 factor (sigma-E family)
VDGRAEFAAFVDASSRHLLRSAWLLTGDWASAEDLVQTALAATWKRWHGLDGIDAPEAYVRRVMLTTFIRWRRRKWRGEIPTETLPERPVDGDETERVDTQAAVRTALATLPPKQRAVVVMRYFADLSEAETAHAMGCSVGTVKSQASRALHRLHDAPGLAELMTGGA